MTNSPSIAIRTAPAPVENNNTSREDKGIPLPMAEGGNAPPAPDVPPPSMVQKIGNTIYEVSFHFSTTSRETMSDKINRLIRRDLEAS